MSKIDTVRCTSPRDVPPGLYAKYSKSGPRYTSYPTAPQFRTDFDADEVRRLWQASNAGGSGLSLYVHIPFCRKRCLYCGCNTEVGHSMDMAWEYVSTVLKEADRMLELIDAQRPLRQLALGGGTPTFLAPELMAELIGGLKKRFTFAEDIEHSVEIDPQSVDAHYLTLLTEMGFNRFSFGVQDLDPAVQKAIGRVQSEELLHSHIRHLQGLGQSAINIDLIYGLPLQTPDSFSTTVGKIAQLRPSRVVLFGYAHVPWVSPHQKALERYHLPAPDERMELFGLGYEVLRDAGYEQVGMDHFALPEDELIAALKTHSLTRNFMGYTTKRGLDLVGLGASSISSVGGTFTQNVKGTRDYIEEAGAVPWTKALVLSAEDRLRGEVILELMCNFYLDTAAIEAKYGIDFSRHFARQIEELEPLEADGLVEVTAGAITVSELGRFFIRNICMPFDEYLKQDGSATTYSKTV